MNAQFGAVPRQCHYELSKTVRVGVRPRDDFVQLGGLSEELLDRGGRLPRCKEIRELRVETGEIELG
jgi:hypothetical protein